jgi:hypothetical protein
VSVAVSKGEFAPVSSELVAAGGEVDAWFARAFANDIDERFESAQELTRTFVEVCETTAEAPTIEGSSSFDTAPAALEPSPASTADPATATARAEAKTEPSAGGSKRWLVGVAIAGLATWWFVTGDPQVDSSGPVASAMVSATASANATTTSRAPQHASRKRKGGRLPPNHIQTMVRRNFDALSSCLDTEKALRRAMVRTLRFVIQEDGTTADVHVGEMDPSTPSLDACLVAKIQAMGFSPPEGGVVTVSYPIVFSNDDWQPLDRAACRMTPDCRGNGRCGVSKESCAVTEDEDCTLSRLCVQRGQCHADGGRCVAGAEGGPDSLPCERFGLCAVAEGQARAGSDEHCKKSKACGAHGICSADHGVCVAANDDDCNKSAYCRIAGR